MASQGGFTLVLKYLFYMSVVAVVLFLLLVFLHFTTIPIFTFSLGGSGIIPVPVPTAQQTAFAKAPASSDLSCNFTGVTSDSYTISFEVFLNGEFVTTTVPRVLLYRAAEPVVLQSSDTIDSIDTAFPDSNILVYVDPLKNDLYVSVLDSANPPNLIISDPVENIPLRQAFRVAIAVASNFVEIYMNGEFVQSIPIGGNIATSPDISYFFGPPAIAKQSVLVGNINFWNFIMSAKAIRAFSSKPIVIA
jgi:hypothetical protein